MVLLPLSSFHVAGPLKDAEKVAPARTCIGTPMYSQEEGRGGGGEERPCREREE